MHEASRTRSPGGIVWLAGLTGWGISALASALGSRLAERHKVAVLGGDAMRAPVAGGVDVSGGSRHASVQAVGRAACDIARSGTIAIVVTATIADDALRDARLAADAEGLVFVEVSVESDLDALVDSVGTGPGARTVRSLIAYVRGAPAPGLTRPPPEVTVRANWDTMNQSVEHILAALARAGIPADLDEDTTGL